MTTTKKPKTINKTANKTTKGYSTPRKAILKPDTGLHAALHEVSKVGKESRPQEVGHEKKRTKKSPKVLKSKEPVKKKKRKNGLHAMAAPGAHKAVQKQLKEINSRKIKKVAGRPKTWICTREIGNLICRRVSTTTLSLKKMCACYDDMPSYDTINEWRLDYPKFSVQYAEAKMIQADLMIECLPDMEAEIRLYRDAQGNERVDTGQVMHNRVRTDTLKWIASKLIPKVYGSTKELADVKEHNAELQRELDEVRAKLKKANEKDY